MTTLDPRTPTKAVFYFRTLDRWPGGNADMLTLKVTRPLIPDAELEAQFYRCFDGNHAWYPARRITLDPGDALAGFLELARSLAARGEQALAFNALDPSEDDWDCEWAESEIHLFADDDGPESPDDAVLRLIRRPSKFAASPPDPELERAFELAHRLTGVGRVFEFANTKDALSAAYRAPGGPAMKTFEYTREKTPDTLPPETDAAFLELQAPRKKRASKAPKAPEAPKAESILLYRLDELPEDLTRGLSPDATPRQCVFFAARPDNKTIDALFEAIPEPDHDEADEALRISEQITKILGRSHIYARWLRPDEVWDSGSRTVGGDHFGFHGGDADEVERWLAAQGVERVSLRSFLDQLILLRAVDQHGAPLEQLDALVGGPPAHTKESFGDGLFVFERDQGHARFKLTPVLDEEPDPEHESWVVLQASELPPGAVHTVAFSVQESEAPPKRTTAKKAPAKKTTKKTASKKAASKKAASKKAASKKAASKKAASKKAASKKAASKKAASKKAASKKASMESRRSH